MKDVNEKEFKDRVKLNEDYSLIGDDSIIYFTDAKHPNLNFAVNELIYNTTCRLKLSVHPNEEKILPKNLLGKITSVEIMLDHVALGSMHESKFKDNLIEMYFLNAQPENVVYNVRFGNILAYIKEEDMRKVPCHNNNFLNFAVL
jgi:hypothetical protein